MCKFRIEMFRWRISQMKKNVFFLQEAANQLSKWRKIFVVVIFQTPIPNQTLHNHMALLWSGVIENALKLSILVVEIDNLCEKSFLSDIGQCQIIFCNRFWSIFSAGSPIIFFLYFFAKMLYFCILSENLCF